MQVEQKLNDIHAKQSKMPKITIKIHRDQKEFESLSQTNSASVGDLVKDLLPQNEKPEVLTEIPREELFEPDTSAEIEDEDVGCCLGRRSRKKETKNN